MINFVRARRSSRLLHEHPLTELDFPVKMSPCNGCNKNLICTYLTLIIAQGMLILFNLQCASVNSATPVNSNFVEIAATAPKIYARHSSSPRHTSTSWWDSKKQWTRNFSLAHTTPENSSAALATLPAGVQSIIASSAANMTSATSVWAPSLHRRLRW